VYPWLNATFEHLSDRIAKKKLHHAILLQGPSGLGKACFALNLAQFLLCNNRLGANTCGSCQSCQLNAANTHPDLHIIESEKQIGVDQIRGAIKTLVGSAQMSGAKVLIIYQANKMTESSANALLKTLEEPTGNTFLLLTTDKPERILPTIKSRCEKLLLPLPSLETTLDWVKSQYSGQVDVNFAKLFNSRPLALLAELHEQQAFTYEIYTAGLDSLFRGQVNAMQLAIDWQEHTDKVLKWTQYWIRQQCVDMASDKIWRVSQQATTVSQQLNNPGLNKVLVLTELLDKLALSQAA
jgi:DNA polymerase-3 subunit delta'